MAAFRKSSGIGTGLIPDNVICKLILNILMGF